MLDQKRLIVNSELCDTRKMKEEDFSSFEQIVINAEILVVNERSRSILNRLPVIINTEKTVDLPEDYEVSLKNINGSYKITDNTIVGEHMLLIVNGSLTIESGAEEVLAKYEQIIVNGSVRYPRSVEQYLNKIIVNGNMEVYPDGSILLDNDFVLDKYFPLRAKENSSYYAKKVVIIKDVNVDISKLVSKNIHFITKTLIVPETKIEECACLFDEKTEFIVVPEGMKLLLGDASLNKEVTLNRNLILKEGKNLFAYGNLRIDERENMEAIAGLIEKLIIKGKISIRKEQLEAFNQMDVEYDNLEILDNWHELKNLVEAKIDLALLESFDEGIRVCNAARVVIDEAIDPKVILEKLRLKNCAMVVCSKKQEGSVNVVSVNVAKIGDDLEGKELGLGSLSDMIKAAANIKIVNAEVHIM